ncbi:MAG: hypothetical protein KJ799_11445 [Bacteroidetes bacterium]|nr:hypothetical protein [Bacteroidota bacterium]MBU1679953.1 hypothetical protein [Bacteroidota bacterium]MBU2507322.1 hypothetical protein [Bacteroidota bacterium]
MKTISKHSLTLLLLSFLFAKFILAQDSQADSSSVQGDNYETFNIYFVNGYGLSYELIKSHNSIIRIQVDLHNNYLSIDSEGSRTNSPAISMDSQPYSEDKKTEIIIISLASHFLYKFYESKFGIAYLGGGPSIGYSKHIYETGSSYNELRLGSPERYSNSYKNLNTSYSLGLNLLLGLKANISANVGFFAESHFNIGKIWVENEYSSRFQQSSGNSSTTINKSEGDGWFTDSNFFRVGISMAL